MCCANEDGSAVTTPPVQYLSYLIQMLFDFASSWHGNRNMLIPGTAYTRVITGMHLYIIYHNSMFNVKL